MSRNQELKSRILSLEKVVSEKAQAEAVHCMDELMVDFPDRYEVMVVCAQYYKEFHDYKRSAELMDQCLDINCSDREVLKFSFEVYLLNKDYSKCLDVAKRYLQLNPNDYEFYEKYAYSFQKLGDYRQALLVWKFLEDKGRITSGGLCDMADCIAQLQMGIDKAIEYSMRAIEKDPNSTKSALRLGQLLSFYGESEYAAKCFKSYSLRCLDVNIFNFSDLYSNYLFFTNYNKEGGRSVDEIFNDHCQYSTYLKERRIEPHKFSYAKKNSRKIRVGFVSADYYIHPVAFFLQPLLENINRDRFDITLYSTTSKNVQDRLTEVFKGYGFKWVDISATSDLKAYETIKDDENHILIDLSGHTAGNRLACFALRMAPLQVNWLGYPNTTGLKNMDYRIVDNDTDPLEYADEYATEELIRIDESFLCYRVPEESSLFNPRTEIDRIIFSSYNNLLKISDSSLILWANVLAEVEDSQLVLKYQYTGDHDVSSYLMDRMKGFGIDTERVKLLPAFKKFEDHLSSYNNVDISLDPFPYNGTTSTCEALIMGIPVITLKGFAHASRVSSSILLSSGLGELVANSEKEYVDIALKLVERRKTLHEYKHHVRKSILNSPLTDEKTFTSKFEKSLETMYSKIREGN